MNDNIENYDNTNHKRKHNKKTEKSYFDDDKVYHSKLNKQFKQRKKQIIEDDDSWQDWQDYK